MTTQGQGPISYLGVRLPPGRLWSSSQLVELGFSAKAIRKLNRTGFLYRLRRGCYVELALWKSLSRRDQAVQQILAHAHITGRILSSGTDEPKAIALRGGRSKVQDVSSGSTEDGMRPKSSYSHTTAARLHGLYLWDVPALIHLTCTVKHSTVNQSPDVRRHLRPLPDPDLVELHGVTVTSLERTVIDCAVSLELCRALIIADHALRKGADMGRMARLLEGMAGQRGVRNARRVLEMADARSESPGETRTRIIVAGSGLPMPQPQLKVHTKRGHHRLDFGWKERKVALEFDGDTKYFDYGPTDEALLAERKRESALIEDGWFFVRIEWRDLSHPEEVVRRIHRALGRPFAR